MKNLKEHMDYFWQNFAYMVVDFNLAIPLCEAFDSLPSHRHIIKQSSIADKLKESPKKLGIEIKKTCYSLIENYIIPKKYVEDARNSLLSEM